ncbi:MAG TPA: MAE_28990/MAE_18760 family HEPN-like nuclease [Burkholderiales bacterium]|nr:MAE_28990/MAE_18760 family HEPN-like nuclease [Burkholderiales bacterium]
MIVVTPEKVRSEIAAVCALSQFNEYIRSHIIDEADLSPAAVAAGATNYLEARHHVAEPLQWKVFSHCASVTRLYALYEGFVYELISAWVKAVPSLYSSYARMPEAIVNQHRVGVGVLLQKFGGGYRNEQLTELRIIEPLYFGLSGQEEFSLVSDAFFIDLRNLRHDELCGLFNKVSLDNLGGWLGGHMELQAVCNLAGTTVVGQLKELVDFRNEASHARQEIDETLGVSEIQQIAQFIQLLCDALHEFVLIRYFDALQEVGRLESLGRITKYFPRPDATILAVDKPVQINVGDEIVARGDRVCIATTIVSLQNAGISIETAKANQGNEIGVKFRSSVKKEGLTIYRISSSRLEGDSG